MHNLLIRHHGPMILIEAGRLFETSFRNVKDELLVVYIQYQEVPRNGEKLVFRTENAPKRQDRVAHATGPHVNHYVADLAEVLALAVDDGIAR